MPCHGMDELEGPDLDVPTSSTSTRAIHHSLARSPSRAHTHTRLSLTLISAPTTMVSADFIAGVVVSIAYVLFALFTLTMQLWVFGTSVGTAVAVVCLVAGFSWEMLTPRPSAEEIRRCKPPTPPRPEHVDAE